MDTAAAECAREYYRALDDHDYDAFDGLLAGGFVHDRPDRTFEGRERFVEFMREERPNRDTTHHIDGVYHPHSALDPDARARSGGEDGANAADGTGITAGTADAANVVVQGRLLDDDEVLFEFVDLFDVDEGRIERVDTYARSV